MPLEDFVAKLHSVTELAPMFLGALALALALTVRLGGFSAHRGAGIGSRFGLSPCLPVGTPRAPAGPGARAGPPAACR